MEQRGLVDSGTRRWCSVGRMLPSCQGKKRGEISVTRLQAEVSSGQGKQAPSGERTIARLLVVKRIVQPPDDPVQTAAKPQRRHIFCLQSSAGRLFFQSKDRRHHLVDTATANTTNARAQPTPLTARLECATNPLQGLSAQAGFGDGKKAMTAAGGRKSPATLFCRRREVCKVC